MSRDWDRPDDAGHDGAGPDAAHDDGPVDGGDDGGGELYDVYSDDVEWTDDDESRYQARRHEELRRQRRRRRQGVSFAVIVLLVAGIGTGAAGLYQGWWEWPFDEQAAVRADAVPCPDPTRTAADPAEVTVRVLNATDTRGLAATVAAELQARGLTVPEVGNDPAEVPDVAQVRYGPASALAARTVWAQFPGAVLVDDGREGTAVEVSVGAAFTGLNPVDVAAQAVAPVPGPSPSGCVTPAPTPAPTDPATTDAPAPEPTATG